MPDGEFRTIGGSSRALAEIAAEMGEIFDRASIGWRADAESRPAAVIAVRPSPRRPGAGYPLLIAAAAGLFGIAAGAEVIRSLRPAAPAPFQVAAKTRPPGPQAKPRLLPSPSGSPPVALAETASPPATGPLPSQVQLPTKAPLHAAGPAARAQPAPPSLSQGQPQLDGLRETAPADANPPVRLAAPPTETEPSGCDANAGGADCRHALAQADLRLRTAYDAAIERGVSGRVLRDYGARWADLRDRDDDNPARLIESYRALASDLQQEKPADRGAEPRPRTRSGLKALKDLLAPWW